MGGGIAGAGQNIVLISQSDISGNTGQGGGSLYLGTGSSLNVDTSTFRNNLSGNYESDGKGGGGIKIINSQASISQSLIIDNNSFTYGDGGNGGGISAIGGILNIDSTIIANNSVRNIFGHSYGGGVYFSGTVNMSNSTVTGNYVSDDYGYFVGSGICSGGRGQFSLISSIIAGNGAGYAEPFTPDDISAFITLSDGHNLIGVFPDTGLVDGDHLNVVPERIFASIDPYT